MMFEEAKFEDGDTEQLTYKDDDNRRFWVVKKWHFSPRSWLTGGEKKRVYFLLLA